MSVIKRAWVNPAGRFAAALERSLLVWNQPLAAAVLAGLIYLGISATAGAPWRLSTTPYHNLLADALLHGQLHLRIIPENPIDLTFYAGRYYLYWPPLPALVAVPLVALFGVGASDVLQTLVAAAAAVGVLSMALQAASEREVIRLQPAQRAMLVLFFALGTPFASITESGHVGPASQVMSLLFVFLACLAAFKAENARAFFLTGCAMAGILLTRTSAVFVGVFLAWYLLRRHWHIGPRRLLRLCLAGIAPVLFALALTALYNSLRFGSPLDNGYNHHIPGVYFADDFFRYGAFHIRNIPANFYYTYIFYPYSLNAPWVTVRCGSLFLLSPLFFYAFYAVWKFRRQPATWVLLGSILLANIPILMLMGPGSALFGPRYALDFAAPLLLLTAMGMQGVAMRYTAPLAVISILQYLFGALIYVHGVS